MKQHLCSSLSVQWFGTVRSTRVQSGTCGSPNAPSELCNICQFPELTVRMLSKKEEKKKPVYLVAVTARAITQVCIGYECLLFELFLAPHQHLSLDLLISVEDLRLDLLHSAET